MSNTFRYGLPLAFAGLLVFAWADAFFLGASTQVPSFENKAAVKAPVFRLDYLDPFPRDAEPWYNDNFPWKGLFQRFNARLQQLTNSRSPLPDLVVLGADDWLYKAGLQLAIYRGKRRFSPEELREVTQELLARKDSVEAQGGKYYLAIAPLKHHIYPEFLPDHVRPLNQEHATRQLYAALDDTDLNYIDLHTPLRDFALENLPMHLRPRPNEPEQFDSLFLASSTTDLYFRTDHHWTVKAGLIAARTIIDSLYVAGIVPTQLKESDYRVTASITDGMTLAKIIGTNRPRQDIILTLHNNWVAKKRDRPELPIPDQFPYKQNYIRHLVQKDPVLEHTLPTLFATRESFGENIIRPISEHFGSSFYLFDQWEHQLNLPDYKREGGDVYLQLIWEGFIFNLLEVPEEDGKW